MTQIRLGRGNRCVIVLSSLQNYGLSGIFPAIRCQANIITLYECQNLKRKETKNGNTASAFFMNEILVMFSLTVYRGFRSISRTNKAKKRRTRKIDHSVVHLLTDEIDSENR